MTIISSYVRCLTLAIVALALGACGGHSSGGDNSPRPTISAAVASLALIAGNSTAVALTITNDSNETVNDVTAVLPAGWSDVSATSCAVLAPHQSCIIYFSAGTSSHAATAINIEGRNSQPFSIVLSVTAPTAAVISSANSTLHLVAGSAVSESITITNNQLLLAATNVAADFTGTALNGNVTQDASGCVSIAPGASCTLTFTPHNTAVTAASFPIKGDNTNVVAGNIEVTLPTSATINVTAGSPLVLQATNGSAVAGTLTITNASTALTATNIAAVLTGTALDGAVTQDASNCASVPPLASCTLSFTPGNSAVANTSVIIHGDNTSQVAASIAANGPLATLSVTGSPLVLFANGSTGSLTVTNTSVDPAANIVSNFTGTALDGLVTETGNTCASVAASASCTLTFTPGGGGVAQTSFPIAGSNTPTILGAIRILDIGDLYQGGVVFKLPSGGNPGLIAATADSSSGIQWGGFGTLTNAQSASDGATNTVTIITALGNNGGIPYAAALCANLTDGGFNDWYLPADNELNTLYLNRVAVGGFNATAPYWSSTETSGNPMFFANIQEFDTGSQLLDVKNSAASFVRCIRQFN